MYMQEQSNIETIVYNTVKMIANRDYIDKKDISKVYEKLMSVTPDNLVFKIPITLGEFTFKIIPQKVSTLNRSSGVIDFLTTYKEGPTIVIATEVSRKAIIDAQSKFPNSQLFNYNELLVDRLECDIVPKHEILTKKEKEEFFREYKIKRKDMPKILVNDPMAKYYNAKPGDVFRITRPNEATIESNFYRLVVTES